MDQCPSCSRILYFTHSDTTVLTCTCGTVVNRKEGSVLVAKPFYMVQQASDLVQPGTTGQWRGEGFTVLGRIRCWLEESVWNYWTIRFEKGGLGYLGEGYGLYSIMKQVTLDDLPNALDLSHTAIASRVHLFSDEEFLMERKSVCTKWEVEGEVYLPETNASFKTYEYSGQYDRQIVLFQWLPNYIMAFEAWYEEVSALDLQQVNEEARAPHLFSCRNCSYQVAVTTYPYAQSVACSNCGFYFQLKQHSSFVKDTKRNQIDYTYPIALGSTGIIKDIPYSVIGMAVKEDFSVGQYKWREYTLYNKKEGYAFLSEYDGHWIYVKEKGNTPVLPRMSLESFEYHKEPFQLYNVYSSTIVHAVGEFTNNIFNNESIEAREFISPPEMWILEHSKKEGISWFLGMHMAPDEMKEAFPFPDGLPPRDGIGAIEPRSFISNEKLFLAGVAGLLFLLFLHTALGFRLQNRELLNNMYTFTDSSNTHSFVTNRFTLEKWRSNLEFHINAPVSNSWFEMNATLVNVATGAEYSVEQGVEYYSGYSEGEHWTEGSTEETAYLTQIPAGTYYLQVQGIREASLFPLSNYYIRVTYDVGSTRNLIFSLLLLACWPVFQYIRINSVEKRRWYNSPFSPFSYED